MQLLLELSPYVSLIVSVIGFIVTILLWMARKEFATNSAVGAAMARANDAHHRIDLIEERMKSLPTGEDIKALGSEISSMATEMRENRVRVETAVLGVKRIEDFLLQGAKA